MSENVYKKKEIFNERYNFTLEDKITLNFSLKNCQKDFYYKIIIPNQDSLLGNFEKFVTEEILCHEDNSEIIFSKQLVCNFIFNKRQLFIINVNKGIDIYSSIVYKSNERVTILSSLITSPDSTYERVINEKEKDSEKIIIKLNKDKYTNENKTSMFDFIKNGIKFSCFISIDFSNGQNENLLSEEKDNIDKIIKNITDVISIYTSKRCFNVYGIGGKIKYENSFKDVFNVSMNESDASISNYSKIINKYDNCINKVISDNKIYLSPLLNKINSDINKLKEYNNYNLLFILIRENVHESDIKNTIDSIIESSYLPLSIFIIGVGKSNFNKMNLIMNSIPKKSNTGIEKMRNNVVFLSLNSDCYNDIEKMIEICLKELINQMLFFYDLIKFTPEQIQQNNYESIKNSFSIFNSNVIISKNYFTNREENQIPSSNYFLSSVFNISNNIEEKEIKNNIENQKFDTNFNINEHNKYDFNNYDNSNNYHSYPINDNSQEQSKNSYISKKPKLYSINDNDGINNNDDNIQIINNNKDIVNEQKENNNNIEIFQHNSIIDIGVNNNNNNDNKEQKLNMKIIPQTSVFDGNIINVYSKDNSNETNNNKLEIKDNNINSNTSVIDNSNKIFYNPYAEDYKKRNSEIIKKIPHENTKKNNSDNSQFSSTNNSENSKESKNVD